MSDLTPDEKEQAEMNAEFEKASIQERSRLGLLLIPISEFASMISSIDENQLLDVKRDTVNTLIRRKPGKTEFGKYIYDLLARAFRSHKKNVEKGKRGMNARWGKQKQQQAK